MPALVDGQKLHIEQYPALFKDLLTSVLNICQGEQLRVQDSRSEVVPQLIQEFTSYVYNNEPFRSHPWTRETKPLKWWTQLSKNMNARLLAVSSFLKISILILIYFSSRKSQSKFFLFHLQRSAMNAPPLALAGLMQHAEAQWHLSIWLTPLNYMTTMLMGLRTAVLPIPLMFTSQKSHLHPHLQLLLFILLHHWWISSILTMLNRRIL